MTGLIEKIADIAMGILISVTCIMFITGRPMLELKRAEEQQRKDIMRLEITIQDIAVNLSEFQKAVSLVAGKDNIDVAAKLQQVEQLGAGNKKLLDDINGIILNSPEKVLGLKDINMKLAVFDDKLKDIKADVDKNSDRFVSNLENRTQILVAILIAVIGLKVFLTRKPPSAKH